MGFGGTDLKREKQQAQGVLLRQGYIILYGPKVLRTNNVLFKKRTFRKQGSNILEKVKLYRGPHF